MGIGALRQVGLTEVWEMGKVLSSALLFLTSFDDILRNTVLTVHQPHSWRYQILWDISTYNCHLYPWLSFQPCSQLTPSYLPCFWWLRPAHCPLLFCSLTTPTGKGRSVIASSTVYCSLVKQPLLKFSWFWNLSSHCIPHVFGNCSGPSQRTWL